MLIPSVSTTHSNISETAAHSSIFQAMARICSIVLAVASEYLEDDEEEVEAASELGLEVCSNFFVQRDAAPQLQTLPLEALPQIYPCRTFFLMRKIMWIWIVFAVTLQRSPISCAV